MAVLCVSHFTLLFLMGVPISLEPAAYSVKTTPRTRNPKATKLHFPPMSLTLQVTFHFHFQAHAAVFLILLHSFFSVTHSAFFHPVCIISVCITFCLTLSPISFYLSKLHINCVIKQVWWWWFAQGMLGWWEVELCFVLFLKTCVIQSEIIAWVLSLEYFEQIFF